GMAVNELRINPNQDCLGHVLTSHGYRTGYIGKWHLWANELGNHDDPKNSYTPPGDYRLGFDGYWASYGFHHTYWDQYYHENSPERIVIPGYEPDGQTDLAIAKLREAKQADKPFAMFLSLGTPHDPWEEYGVPAAYYDLFREVDFQLPPNYKPENDPYADAWARLLSEDQRGQLTEWMRVYYAMTANLDWNVGRLLDAVDDMGLHENTIFVFTSDHGEMFGAQGRRAKNIFYEEAVHVPFVLRYPVAAAAGSVSDACLNTPDIMPTLLAMMNLSIPAEVEGMDLSHCAYGQPGPEPEAAFMQGMGATAIFEDGHEWRALRSKQYTYAVYLVDGKELLFDNLADPYQMCNLIDDPDHQATVEHFRQMLNERMNELNDTFEACTWYRDHWTDDRLILRTATLSTG
ncbi:MAG: sulfatase-like hydrolase/transferase, partial [Anaerolineae bacterium]|nr:sulfatase-like hydrolase/transferase [Anaerolineae bacterium]